MVITHSLRGRNFLRWADFSVEEIKTILAVAKDLKKDFVMNKYHDNLLRAKTLFMIFYNRSLRTRNSFEAGMTQLGGHAHDLTPSTIYSPAMKGHEEAYSTERVSDVARVLARMGHGIAIRCYGSPVGWDYGRSHQMMEEFAQWSHIPIINMESDIWHPMQSLADAQTMLEKSSNLQNKKFVISWAYSGSPEKPMAVPQSCAFTSAMLGMDVVIAHPKGFELHPDLMRMTQDVADKAGGSVEVSYEMKEAFEGADFVYPKSWTSLNCIPPRVNKPQMDKARELFSRNNDWICTQELMDITGNGYYMHCLPADRGQEVTDEVIDGPQSIVFDQAENRLHAQKAVMVLLM